MMSCFRGFRVLLAVVVALCVPNSVWAGNRPFMVAHAERVAECGAAFTVLGNDGVLPSDASALQVNVPLLTTAVGAAATVELVHFPIAPQQMGSVVLRRLRSVVDANTQFYIGNNPAPMPAVQRYVGTVRGESASKVFLCIVGTTVIASVERGDGTVYTLAPALGKSSSTNYVMANEVYSSNAALPLACNAENASAHLHREQAEVLSAKHPRALSDKLLEVKVAVEADTRFFQQTGGTVEKATAYLVSLLSLASVVYEDEVKTTFYLPWIKIWTDNPADPYQVNGDGYALAPKALDYWQKNHEDVQRDLVHVLTAGGGGGIGYLFPLANGGGTTTLCTNSGLGASSPFADHTFPTLAFTYGVYIVAHEMGHSFGAVHTHKCFWNPPLDTCMTQDDATFQAGDACYTLPITPRANSGSIMSYCAGVNKAQGKGYGLEMTFLPPVASYMREQVEQAACVVEPLKPTVVLTAPRGEAKFLPTDDIAITWLSARVDNVSLQYSLDGGEHWVSIATAIPAGEKYATWKPEDICSRNVVVRIADATNDAVADTSIVPLNIEGPHPECLVAHFPIEGDARDVQCGFFTATNEGATLVPNRKGILNSAFQFDGSGRLVAPNFSFQAKEITATFWFRTSDLGSVETIMGTDWEQQAVVQTYVWNGVFGAAFWIAGQGVPVQVWSLGIQKDTWYFGAISYDGTTAKVYLNGKLTGSTEKQGTLNAASGAFPLYFGARGNKEYLRGAIDDVRLYCRALSGEDILVLMDNATAPQQAPDLIEPPNNTSVEQQVVRLRWNSVPLAESFHVQIAEQEDMQGTMLLDEESIPDTTTTQQLPTGGPFYWRVAARNGVGASPWSSVYSFLVSPASSVAERDAIAVLPVYPNPCADNAVLSYRTSASGMVHIGLYNALGQELRRIQSGWVDAGMQTSVLPVADIAPGVYLVKIVHGATTVVQRIIVAR